MGAEIYPLGDSCVIVRFGEQVDPQIMTCITRFALLLQEQPFQGFREVVPAMVSTAVYYDPVEVYRSHSHRDSINPYDWVVNYLRGFVETIQRVENLNRHYATKLIRIPVCYETGFGADLIQMSKIIDCTPDQIIELHSSRIYTVYMIGFLPGFPYLGSTHELLKLPRKSMPSTSVPAGSVGIAEQYTCIYPVESPGGWHIIGRTPVQLFDALINPPALLAMGDHVQFYPITAQQFHEWQEMPQKP